jgi:hypothetical protein
MLQHFLKLVPRHLRPYSGGNIGGIKKLSALDKRIMVFGGTYKSTSEVPDSVPPAQYQKAREKFRIKLNIIAILSTLAACGYMMFLGQKDSEDGKSFHNEVLEKHERLREGNVAKSK